MKFRRDRRSAVPSGLSAASDEKMESHSRYVPVRSGEPVCRDGASVSENEIAVEWKLQFN